MPSREEMPKIIGIVLAKSPKLVLKISWRYLKAKKKAQRAETVFRNRLKAKGIDGEAIDKLAEKYSSTVSLRAMMKEIGIPGIAFNGDNRKHD
ncbi:MAG: hypothetical protein LN414_02550 [Candidatus Thermoplasmatota archaeon]|nr:hypothetical protein [Candidatus Thermoplasmatota archaeon]